MGKTITRAGEAAATGGLSEFTHGTDAFGAQTALQKLGLAPEDYKPQLLPNTDPIQGLATVGGAPLLANIAMGVSPSDAIAGYFGKTPGDDYNTWKSSLSQDEQSALSGIENQMGQIQSNTDLRNKAVQSVVNDFPNVAAQAAQARQSAGGEFDQTTKDAVNLALSQTASKYAANGMLSSGAADAAVARVGAQNAQDKLAYMDKQGNTSYQQGLDQWNARYTEANALRGFQQKMLGQGVDAGFSANQKMLDRTQQTNQFNANALNTAQQSNNANKSAMLGAFGSVAGTMGAYAMFGPAAGAAKGAAASSETGFNPQTMSTPTGANANPANYGISTANWR